MLRHADFSSKMIVSFCHNVNNKLLKRLPYRTNKNKKLVWSPQVMAARGAALLISAIECGITARATVKEIYMGGATG